MELYPSIPGSAKAPLGTHCIAQYKYDGSNLRWEWSPKNGWSKFGTRKHLFDHTDTVFGEAIPIFLNTMADEIVYRTKQAFKNPQRITAFTEFFGANSFAGSHEPGDEKHLKLFDIYLFQKGLIPVKEFVKIFGDLPYTAETVYEGNLNKQFIIDVRTGKYNVFEGVIAKGVMNKSNGKGTQPFAVKIKTDEYFTKLKHKYPNRWQEFGE